MWTKKGTCLGVALLCALQLVASASALTVRTCNKCGPGECQVLGMQRYSEPRCEPLGELGAPCRMWQEPENKTLAFPNRVLLECSDVYLQLCPCAAGLQCREAKCGPAGEQRAAGGERRPPPELIV